MLQTNLLVRDDDSHESSAGMIALNKVMVGQLYFLCICLGEILNLVSQASLRNGGNTKCRGDTTRDQASHTDVCGSFYFMAVFMCSLGHWLQ